MTIPALAASGELRLLARRCPRLAGYEIHIRGVATSSGRVFFPALAAAGHRSHTRAAATHVKAGRREAWRLDLWALSRKTARTVARDGCRRGLAVHSVRSWADKRNFATTINCRRLP